MNANYNFSRRFFAEFIASRINAWSLERGKSASPGLSSVDRSSGSKAGTNPRAGTETRRDGSGLDDRHPRLPGMSDPRRSHGLEIG